MQSIPYWRRAATKRSMYLAPPPNVAKGPSCREICPTLADLGMKGSNKGFEQTCICPCFGGFQMLNSRPSILLPQPRWAPAPELPLLWSDSWSGSRRSGWSRWWTSGSRGRWRRRQCHRRRAVWGRARCPGRRRRPGPRTARCCRSPTPWSSVRLTRTQSLSCAALSGNPGGWGRLALSQLLWFWKLWNFYIVINQWLNNKIKQFKLYNVIIKCN